MRFVMIAILLCSVALGNVSWNSEHYSDASAVNDLLESQGYSPTVNIVENDNGGCSYAVMYYGDYYDPNYDLQKVTSSILACAVVSETTSWSSNMAMVIFEDQSLCMMTGDARTLWNYIQANGYADETAGLFYMNNLIIYDQGLSDL